MTLIARAWAWLTRRLLDGDVVGHTDEYRVVKSKSSIGAILELAAVDDTDELIQLFSDGDGVGTVRMLAGADSNEIVINAPMDLGDQGAYFMGALEDRKEVAEKLELPAYRDPVEELHSLEDEHGRVYLWECEDDAKADSLLRQFDEAGASAFDALHIVVADETELRELSKADLEPYLGGLE